MSLRESQNSHLLQNRQKKVLSYLCQSYYLENSVYKVMKKTYERHKVCQSSAEWIVFTNLAVTAPATLPHAVYMKYLKLGFLKVPT